MLLYFKIPDGMTYVQEDGIDCFKDDQGTTHNIQVLAKEAIRTYNKSKMVEPKVFKSNGLSFTVYYHPSPIRQSTDLFLAYQPKNNGKEPSAKAEVKTGKDIPPGYSVGSTTLPWINQTILRDQRRSEAEERRAEQRDDRRTKGLCSV